MPVDLDHLQRQRAANQPGHVGLLAGLVAAPDLGDLRGRDEPAHAIEIHQETALVVIGDLGLDDLVGLVQFLQPAPALLLAGAVDADDRVPLLVLRLHHKDQDRVANRKRLALVRRKARVLPRRDDPFRLRADIDQDLLAVEVHDHPVHDIPVFQALVVVAGIVEELLHERSGIQLGVIGRNDFFRWRLGHSPILRGRLYRRDRRRDGLDWSAIRYGFFDR